MITKTLTGVPFFDKHYGGIYRGRAMLVSGKAGSGKSVLGLQFIHQAIKQNERCLILSAKPVNDLLIFAEALKLPLSEAVDAGNLVLLEYRDYIPSRDSEEYITLPPDGFLQFKEIIDAHAIQRIVLDTVLPWVSIRPQMNLAEHIFSFVHSFERIGVTTLMTIPKPASLPSIRLKNALEAVVPVSVTLSTNANSDEKIWIATKYLGEIKLEQGTPYQITPGVGLAAITAASIKEEKPVVQPQAQPVAADLKQSKKIKFSDVVSTQVTGAPVEKQELLSWLKKQA
ncbi:MAG: ATPase domain-containing protein [Kiritimatiellae bacterium]|nr:ATPase domain-containing protein [Kiritimatiellia bacterium]